MFIFIREKRGLAKGGIHRKRPTQQFLTGKALNEGTTSREILPMTGIFLHQTADNLLLFSIERHQYSQDHNTRNDFASSLVVLLQTGECEELFVVVEQFFQIIVMHVLDNTQIDEVFQ